MVADDGHKAIVKPEEPWDLSYPRSRFQGTLDLVEGSVVCLCFHKSEAFRECYLSYDIFRIVRLSKCLRSMILLTEGEKLGPFAHVDDLVLTLTHRIHKSIDSIVYVWLEILQAGHRIR
jgi:hypothetical protein